MPPIIVYGFTGSAPVRIVLMACEAMGIDYELKIVDLSKGEHKTEEYLAINPMHNIPAIVDGDFKLNESRAIICYLANAYAKDESIYPKDAKIRAVVDQRMYFDMGTFYKAFGDIAYPVLFGPKGTKIDQDKLERLHEVLGWVEGFVKDGTYVAGTKELTVADLCFLATISTLTATGIIPELYEKYPSIKPYVERVAKDIPNIEKANNEGAKAFGQRTKDKLEN